MNSILTNVFGHENNISLLKKALMNSKLAHSLLLAGPDSVGKKLVSLGCAQAILCENLNSLIEACGKCSSCLRVSKGQSENMLIINSEGSQIKIEESRKILDFLSLANFDRPRVIIIDQCHLLNPQAANALLKTLEEPNSKVYFFLITSSKDSVLQTLRSRSQTIHFFNLDLQSLKLIKPGLEDWVYLSSRGQVKLMNELSDTQVSNVRKKNLQMLQSFFENDFLSESHWRTDFKGREEARLIVHNWVSFLRDCVALKIDPKAQIMNPDLAHELQKIPVTSISKFFMLISDMMTFDKQMLGFLDPVLLIEKIKVQYASH